MHRFKNLFRANYTFVMTEFDLLQKPEYIHVVLNHLPIYGTIFGALALAISLILRSRAAQITALIITLVAAASAYPVLVTGQRAYKTIRSMADDTGAFSFRRVSAGSYVVNVDGGSEYEPVNEQVEVVDASTARGAALGSTFNLQIQLRPRACCGRLKNGTPRSVRRLHGHRPLIPTVERRSGSGHLSPA